MRLSKSSSLYWRFRNWGRLGFGRFLKSEPFFQMIGRIRGTDIRREAWGTTLMRLKILYPSIA